MNYAVSDSDYDTDEEIKRIIAQAKRKKEKQRSRQQNQKKRFSVATFFLEHASFFLVKVASFLNAKSVISFSVTSKVFNHKLAIAWKSLLQRDFPNFQPLNPAVFDMVDEKTLGSHFKIKYAKELATSKLAGTNDASCYKYNTLGEYVMDASQKKIFYWKHLIEVHLDEELKVNDCAAVTLLCYDQKRCMLSVWRARPLINLVHIFEYSLKKEKLVSSKTIGSVFLVITGFENANKKWQNLYVFDPDYKPNWSSQYRQKFRLRLLFLYHKCSDKDKDATKKPEDTSTKKSLTPERSENEISFETDVENSVFSSVDYNPTKLTLSLYEASKKALIQVDLQTYNCKVNDLVTLGDSIEFQVLENDHNGLIFNTSMLAIYNLREQVVEKVIFANGIVKALTCRIADEAVIVYYTSTEICLLEQSNLELIDKFSMLATSNSKIFTVQTTMDLICIVLENFYYDYRKRYAVYQSKLQNFSFKLLGEAPHSIVYPQEAIESDHISASKFSEIIADFRLNTDGSVIFLTWTATDLQIRRLKGESCDLNVSLTFRWNPDRRVTLRYSYGALLLHIFRNCEDYDYRRFALIFPDLKHCYPEHCSKAIPVYSDDSDEHEELWGYVKTTDENNVPIHVLKRRKD